MARMLPPYLSPDIRSSAEVRVFNLFRADPDTPDWVVIHSLGLSRHVKRLYGEIDFVVLAPGLGVFCLEVKGGRVSRRNGVWSFTDRFGDTATKMRSPFMQAREEMFSLIADLRRHFGPHHRIPNLVFRYGVMFPDIVFDVEDPEHRSWEVYDLDDRRHPVSRFVKRLAMNAHREVAGTSWYVPSESSPTPQDLRMLIEFLRGDFERVPSLRTDLEEAEQKLLTLTTQQYECLDQLQLNDRCLFEGSAGTGKTLLALEFARREAAREKRVLLLCYNRLLGLHLERAAKGEFRQPITAGSFHSYLYRCVMQSVHAPEFREVLKNPSDDVYTSVYPFYAELAFQEDGHKPFDLLIVDEGQDLISEEYLDVLDSLLTGGLTGGRWAFFCDFQRQAIFTPSTADEMLHRLACRTVHFTRFRLTVNCRNTRPIGEETALLSGFETLPFLRTNLDGPPVDYRFFDHTSEEAVALRAIIEQLLDAGVTPRQITVLSPVSREKSCIALVSGNTRFEIADATDLFDHPDRQAIGFSTIQAFKGLESTIVVLTDVSDLTTGWGRSLLYVGMSRAKLRLYVLLRQSVRKDYTALLTKAAGKLYEGPKGSDR